ncbi:hypothetical protein ACVWZL_005724 [Bradyrhizobium sp. GM2.4]
MAMRTLRRLRQALSAGYAGGGGRRSASAALHDVGHHQGTEACRAFTANIGHARRRRCQGAQTLAAAPCAAGDAAVLRHFWHDEPARLRRSGRGRPCARRLRGRAGAEDSPRVRDHARLWFRRDVPPHPRPHRRAASISASRGMRLCRVPARLARACGGGRSARHAVARPLRFERGAGAVLDRTLE